MSTEEIIEAVKRYPFLYNLEHPDYKNTRRKDQTWDSIGAQFGASGETIKKKWKNLRDTYAKYLRSLKNTPGQSSKKNYKQWQWAYAMEAFKPFLAFANSELDVTESVIFGGDPSVKNDYFEVSQHSSQTPALEHPPQFSAKPSKKRRGDNDESPESTTAVDKLLSFIQNKRRKTEMDPTELIFLGYAKTIKTFSLRRQALTKMKIAEIMMKAELEHIEDVSGTI